MSIGNFGRSFYADSKKLYSNVSDSHTSEFITQLSLYLTISTNCSHG